MTPGQAHAMKLDISDAKELGDENDEAMELIAMDDNSDDEAPAGKVTQLFPQEAALQQSAQLRMIEAVVFAAAEPLDEATIAERMPPGADIPALLLELEAVYSKRGVNLVRVAGKWAFRTASDVSFVLQKNTTEQKRLSRAGMETLAIVAYHQPVTRAEIEDIRGVTVSKGTIDLLLEVGWVRMRGRRRVPGRPVTYGTTDAFLAHFGLDKVSDLPGLDELKAAGLIEGRVPPAFAVPSPSDALAVDEDPLEAGDTGDHFHAEEEPVQVAEDIAPPQPETPESEG